VNYWDKCGITERHLNAGIGPILASCKCDFKLPLFYPGNITIETELDFLRSSSFGFQHTLYNDNGDVAALASDVMVMFDFKKNIKVIIDEEWRHRISMKY
jgi:acyl-CoA thioester hydrolase